MSIIKRQTILNSIYSYFGVAMGTLSQAYFIPNFFSTTQNGLLQILLSYMLIIAQVASLGFNNAGTRFFPYFKDEKNGHNGYLNLGLKFCALGFLLSVVIVYLFKDQLIASKSTDSMLFARYFDLLIPISLATIIFNLFDNYARAMYESVPGTFYSQLVQRSLTFLAIALFCLKAFTFESFIWFWVVALMLPTLFMLFSAFKIEGTSLLSSKFFSGSKIKKEFYSFAAFSTFTGLSSIIISHVDKIFVYHYLGLSSTGIYATCILFGSVMTMSFNASLKASSAMIMQALKENDILKIAGIYKKSSVTQFIFGSVILLVVWINVDALFGFIKPEYAAGKYVLLIIGLAKLFDLVNGINSLIIAYSKYYKYDSFLIISFLVLLVILNQILIPKYGLNGAAYAAFLSVLYFNIVRTILVWKFFKIHPFGKEHLYIMGIGLITLFVGYQLPDIVNKNDWFSLINIGYKSAVITIIYLGSIYSLNVSPEINEILIKTFSLILKDNK